jgi:hypothetical protein
MLEVEGGLGQHTNLEQKPSQRGRKSFLSLAQKQANSEVHSRKQQSLLGALRAIAPPPPPMIILSLNRRGLANPSRKLAIKRLVDLHHPSVILLQETMQERDKAINSLSPILQVGTF